MRALAHTAIRPLVPLQLSRASLPGLQSASFRAPLNLQHQRAMTQVKAGSPTLRGQAALFDNAAGTPALSLVNRAISARARDATMRPPKDMETIALLQPKDKVIDLGTGTGTAAHVAGKKVGNANVTAIDSDQATVARLKEDPALEGINLIAGTSLKAGGAKPGSVDYLRAANVTPYMKTSELQALFTDAKALMAPGSLAYITNYLPCQTETPHITTRSASDFLALAQECGLKPSSVTIEIETAGSPPKEFKYEAIDQHGKSGSLPSAADLDKTANDFAKALGDVPKRVTLHVNFEAD